MDLTMTLDTPEIQIPNFERYHALEFQTGDAAFMILVVHDAYLTQRRLFLYSIH